MPEAISSNSDGISADYPGAVDGFGTVGGAGFVVGGSNVQE